MCSVILVLPYIDPKRRLVHLSKTTPLQEDACFEKNKQTKNIYIYSTTVLRFKFLICCRPKPKSTEIKFKTHPISVTWISAHGKKHHTRHHPHPPKTQVKLSLKCPSVL